MIIKLYSKGVTTREIADLIEKMYGSHYSPAQVSNISKQMIPKVEVYHKRKLSDKFFCVEKPLNAKLSILPLASSVKLSLKQSFQLNSCLILLLAFRQ